MRSSTFWLSPTDFVSGDPSLIINHPSVSHPSTVVTCNDPGDFKWVSMSLRLPANATIEEITICYQLTSKNSFISQIRLAEIKTPDHATVRHDDSTDLKSTSPDCYTSKIDESVTTNEAAMTLELRLNFDNVDDKIMLGAVGVKIYPTENCCVDTIADLKQLPHEKARCVIVLGYHEPGDGGGGQFFWDASFKFPAGEDFGIIIKPDLIAPSESG